MDSMRLSQAAAEPRSGHLFLLPTSAERMKIFYFDTNSLWSAHRMEQGRCIGQRRSGRVQCRAKSCADGGIDLTATTKRNWYRDCCRSCRHIAKDRMIQAIR